MGLAQWLPDDDKWRDYYDPNDGGGSPSGGTGAHIDPKTGRVDPNYRPPANPTGGGGGVGAPGGSGGGSGSSFDAANSFSSPTAGSATQAPTLANTANPAWYQSIGKAFTGANAYQNWLNAAGLGLAAYQTYRNSQPPRFKDPGLTPEQKRLSDLYFQSLTNPAMANNASHVTDVSNSILNGYMQGDGKGLQWSMPQTFSGQNGGAPVRQAWPAQPNANVNTGAPVDPHSAILNERDPQVQQLAMWMVVNNPTLPPDRALEQARAIVLHSSPAATTPAPAMRQG